MRCQVAISDCRTFGLKTWAMGRVSIFLSVYSPGPTRRSEGVSIKTDKKVPRGTHLEEENSRQAGRPRENFEISGKVVKELEKVEVDFSSSVDAQNPSKQHWCTKDCDWVGSILIVWTIELQVVPQVPYEVPQLETHFWKQNLIVKIRFLNWADRSILQRWFLWPGKLFVPKTYKLTL